MLFSYFVGQQKNPINYDLKSIFIYVGIAVVLFAGMLYVASAVKSDILRMCINTVFVLMFVAPIYYFEIRPHMAHKSHKTHKTH